MIANGLLTITLMRALVVQDAVAKTKFRVYQMSRSRIYVARSPIHGKGLFARKPIPAGSCIGTVEGEWTGTDGPHVLWVDENKGFRVRCDLRFINHSPSPNAVYYDTLEVMALRDIHPGEEITHDYCSD